MVTNGNSGNIGDDGDNDDPSETMMIHWSVIKWADSSPPRILTDLRGLLANPPGVICPVDSRGPAADSARVHGGPKNLLRIRHKHMAEPWTYLSRKKFESAGFDANGTYEWSFAPMDCQCFQWRH